MMNIINSDPGEVPVGNSVAAILREIVNGYEEKRVFDDWSNEQKDIFLRDIKRNIIERNLSILNPGDSVISAYLAPFGKVGYHAATVVGVNEEEIKVQVISDTLREKKYDNRGGVNTFGPDYGWITRSDDNIPSDNISIQSGEE